MWNKLHDHEMNFGTFKKIKPNFFPIITEA